MVGPMDPWAIVVAVAKRQHMLIATWQLRIIGISDRAIADRVRHHGWRRLGPGIFALPAPDDPMRSLAAVVLAHARPAGAAMRVSARTAIPTAAADPADESTAEDEPPPFAEPLPDVLVDVALNAGQAVAGLSALWLHGIGSKPTEHHLRILRPVGTAARSSAQVRIGQWTGNLVWLHGLPVVDVAQAFMDIAAGSKSTSGVALHHQLTKHMATADAKRKITLKTLEERMSSAPRFTGRPALRRAVADLKGELAHSATEAKARREVGRVLATYGLTLHPRPFRVELHGRPVGEADLAIVEICLDIEVDGPHHLLPAQREKDQVRDRWMRRAGWEVERFSTELIDLRPVTFAARVEECVRFRLGK
jgi:hypothetical protein